MSTFETLYKTDNPEELDRAEYYQPRIDVEDVDGKPRYFVREKHGWFDPAAREAVHVVTTLNPEEGFEKYDDADAMYRQQQRHRAAEGFCHAFFADPTNTDPAKQRVNWRRISD